MLLSHQIFEKVRAWICFQVSLAKLAAGYMNFGPIDLVFVLGTWWAGESGWQRIGANSGHSLVQKRIGAWGEGGEAGEGG